MGVAAKSMAAKEFIARCITNTLPFVCQVGCSSSWPLEHGEGHELSEGGKGADRSLRWEPTGSCVDCCGLALPSSFLALCLLHFSFCEWSLG